MAALDQTTEVEAGVAAMSVNEEGAAAEGGAAEEPEAEGAEYTPSANASGNVAELLNKDADDESLRKYKESLLGAAAQGDLGDTSDPRKVVIEEFRVVFNDATEDFVSALGTQEAVAEFSSTGAQFKEGSEYRFVIKFRAQHEILDRLTWKFSLTKMGMTVDSTEVTLGSYAPNSEPYTFEHPRNDWEELPSGMMARGTYTAHITFVDGNKVKHLTFTFPLKITKK